MNKMIDILHETVSPVLAGRSVTEIGNMLYVRLDDSRLVEISFNTTRTMNNYDALFFKLVSKTNGELDARMVHFRDLFSCMQDLTHPNKIGKHIWDSDGKVNWYGRPTAADLAAIRKAVNDYITLWE